MIRSEFATSIRKPQPDSFGKTDGSDWVDGGCGRPATSLNDQQDRTCEGWDCNAGGGSAPTDYPPTLCSELVTATSADMFIVTTFRIGCAPVP